MFRCLSCFAPQTSSAFFSEFYSLDIAVPPAANDAYIKCLFIVAGADGVSDAEWAWFDRRAQLSGLAKSPDYGKYKKWTSSTEKLGSLDNLLPEAGGKSVARTLLYDAISMASADSYGADERAVVKNVAKSLDVPMDVLAKIEKLCANEASAREQKKNVLWNVAYGSE